MAHSPPPGTPGALPPAPALLLDRYQVTATLGRGSFGTVVRAFDPLIKRSVAIKTLNPGLAVQYPDAFTNLRERFVREAEAGARMGVHPHIIAVYDLVAASDGTLYLIQEYAAGGTLTERIKGGALPVAALRLMAEAALGLQAAHEVGIVHRDVKPANLFLTERGQVKVGDFGIAQIDDLSARSRLGAGHHPGTPLYMAPEQARETTYVRVGADQYSLGLVLFELLTGMAYKRLAPGRARELVAEMPPGVGALLDRMTAVGEEGRYATLGVVAGTIEALLPGLAPALIIAPAAPAPPTPSVWGAPIATAPAPRPPQQRHMSRRAVLVGVAGLAVAVGGAWAVSHQGGGGSATAPPVVPTATRVPVTATSVPATATARPSGATAAGRPLQGHTDSVSSVTFSPNGQTLASGSDDTTVRLWRVGDDSPLRTLQGHTGPVLSVAFSPDGQTLASGSKDNTVRLWRL